MISFVYAINRQHSRREVPKTETSGSNVYGRKPKKKKQSMKAKTEQHED